jgi:hypothetical protein
MTDIGDVGSGPAWAGPDSEMRQDSSTAAGSSRRLSLKGVSKSLSLYSSLLALQAQHASSEHDKIIIWAHTNIHDDTPEEKQEQPLPSLFDSGIPQPPRVGTDIEIEPEASLPIQRMTRSKSHISAFVIREVLSRRGSQTTNRDRRGASPGLPPSMLLL